MSETLLTLPENILEALPYDMASIVKNLVTEDDEPVDNLYSAKQQRLLVEPLYSSWTPPDTEPDAAPRPFLADVNVGLYFTLHQKPLVPDMFLSLDVEVGPEWHATHEPRSYFTWEFGKGPEAVVEIVSNRVGNELGSKLRDYAYAGVKYYVVYDPWLNLGEQSLYVYELGLGQRYRLREDFQLPDLNLSLTLWHGPYEGSAAQWLRWQDATDTPVPTGNERARWETERAAQEAARADSEATRADSEATRADSEATRADNEAARANSEAARAERLAAQMRALGIVPEE